MAKFLRNKKLDSSPQKNLLEFILFKGPGKRERWDMKSTPLDLTGVPWTCIRGDNTWTFKRELKWESRKEMAYKYAIDKLHGSVSQSLAVALLTNCPPAYLVAEIQQKGFTISAHSCYLRGLRWQVSICCVSCHTLCLNTLFILFLFIFQRFILQCIKTQDLEEESSIHTYFTFQQMNLNLLVMSFTSWLIAIISRIVISQENKIEGKKKKTALWRGAISIQLSITICQDPVSSYFSPFTRFDGLTCPFTQCKGIKTNNNRETQTNKQNPPKLLDSCLGQLRMSLYVPASTCGVSYCAMGHCHIANLHEITLKLNYSCLALFGVLQTKVPKSSPPDFHSTFSFYYFYTEIFSCTSLLWYPTKSFTS